MRDVLAVLDSRHVQETDVIGSSFGGLLAIELARTAPSRVRSLVLLDPPLAATVDGGTFVARNDDLFALFLEGKVFADLDEALVLLGADPAGCAAEQVATEVESFLEPLNGGRYRPKTRPDAFAAMLDEITTFSPEFGDYRGPALLVDASRSGRFAPETVRRFRAQLGEAFRHERIESGHALMWDAFEETVSETRSFLDRLERVVAQ
ncbi:hypothetical protein BAY59_22955 [Prauserella coralliicola]|nr:hypothetical protein BAY59_22955 [Prauserella coralliicola]